MIERLKETGGWAFGFKVTGRVTEEDVKAFEPQLEFAIGSARSGRWVFWPTFPKWTASTWPLAGKNYASWGSIPSK